jgi:hypothetical protein
MTVSSAAFVTPRRTGSAVRVFPLKLTGLHSSWMASIRNRASDACRQLRARKTCYVAPN